MSMMTARSRVEDCNRKKRPPGDSQRPHLGPVCGIVPLSPWHPLQCRGRWNCASSRAPLAPAVMFGMQVPLRGTHEHRPACLDLSLRHPQRELVVLVALREAFQP